ncbi:hypothetical protein ES703_109134 [subsurface metagenome]
MSPIDGVSDVRRIPRLGKIRLGIKVEPEGKNPYPRATDYFVVPDEIKEYTGDKPKKLDIMFPTEETDKFSQQWLRCYSFSQGLVCKGNGIKAIRKLDVETGDIAHRATQEWRFRDNWGCDPDTCEQYLDKQCRRVMNLLFLMPNVPGVGCWQLDTTSFYSIVNINSCVDLIRRLCGRISFIPLILSLEPIEVSPPGITKKTVHVLAIRSEVKLADIQRLGRIPPERIMLPILDEEEAPGDLFPEQKVIEAESKKEAAAPPSEPVDERTPDDITEGDVPDLNAVLRICHLFWDMQPVDVVGQLGYKTTMDAFVGIRQPWDAWLTIKGLMQPEKPEEEPEPEQAEQKTEELWPEDIPGAGEAQPEPTERARPCSKLRPS